MDVWTKLTLTFLTALAIHTGAKFTIKKAFAAYSVNSVLAQVGIVWLYAILLFVVTSHCTRYHAHHTHHHEHHEHTSKPSSLPLFELTK